MQTNINKDWSQQWYQVKFSKECAGTSGYTCHYSLLAQLPARFHSVKQFLKTELNVKLYLENTRNKCHFIQDATHLFLQPPCSQSISISATVRIFLADLLKIPSEYKFFIYFIPKYKFLHFAQGGQIHEYLCCVSKFLKRKLVFSNSLKKKFANFNK